MKITRFLPFLLAVILLTMACNVSVPGSSAITGSGVTNRQQRSLPEFTGVELSGSADVVVNFGNEQSVVVEADDNILPLVETTVRGSTLVIGLKPFASLNTRQPIQVTMTVKALDVASISGSGNITINNLSAKTVNFALSGSGNITAAGNAERVTVSLNGSGNIFLDSLKAKSAGVKLKGSGNIKVYASESLEASIPGSGTVQYRGNPPAVNRSVTGSGNVISVP